MNDSFFWGLIIVLISAAVLFVFMPEVFFKNPFLGSWQADFDFNPEEVNKKQVEKIKLVFEKDGSLNYIVAFREITFEQSSSGISQGSLNSSSDLQMHYHKRGDLLTVSMQARSRSLPFIAPFEMKGVERLDKLAVAQYSARFLFRDGRLMLEDAQSGKQVCFAPAPDSCHNAMVVAGEDGALAGYDPRKEVRQRALGENREEYFVPNITGRIDVDKSVTRPKDGYSSE